VLGFLFRTEELEIGNALALLYPKQLH